MRKALLILLIMSLVFTLVGCVGSDPASVPTNNKTPLEVNSNTEDQENEAVQEPVEIEDKEPSEPVISSSDNANITETVIFDENDIKVTAKSISYDGWMGPELNLLIENNSAQNITVQARNLSVNGLMMDSVLSADVAAGKKANDTMSFMTSSLELANISTIQEMEFVLHIFDTDSWDDIANSDVIVLSTDATDYTQEYDDSGIVAYDENGIKIVAKKLNSTESFWGADLYLYIENNSEQDITVQAQDVSIDGFMIDPIFSSDIVHGKKAFDSITFLESDLTENGITDIKEIELRFHIFDLTSWDTIKDSDIVTISFE